MTMINAIHIEDEPANIKLLDIFLKKCCGDIITLKGNAANTADGLQLMKKINPALVFLDVELNDGDSFDFLDAAKEFDFEVIFITAHSDFAVKAFRYEAVDYLLKPIDIKQLKYATEKAINIIKSKETKPKTIVPAKINKDLSGIKKIGLPVEDGMLFINLDEIIYCEAQGNYSFITLSTGKTIPTTKTLKELELMLPAGNFLRVHHSWIINVNFLKKYYRGKNSYMEMENGKTVSVSLRKKGDFLDFFQ
jgi:two-component system, LytTR family, response regulator